MHTIDEALRLARGLPPDLQREVADYIETLANRRTGPAAKPMRLGWRGALRELRGQYTAVQLQHKLLDWWG